MLHTFALQLFFLHRLDGQNDLESYSSNLRNFYILFAEGYRCLVCAIFISLGS